MAQDQRPPAVIGRVVEPELAAGLAHPDLSGPREQPQTAAEDQVIMVTERSFPFGGLKHPKGWTASLFLAQRCRVDLVAVHPRCAVPDPLVARG